MNGPGVVVACFASALFAAVTIVCGSAMISVSPLLALAVNGVVVAGVAPTVWQWRAIRVWRWVLYGAAAGVLLGWVALLLGAR